MAVTMLALWRFKSLRVNVVMAYRFFFPFAITAILLLPFLPRDYGNWVAAIMYALYSAAIMLMMIQCAQASRDRGINPVFIYGFFGSIVYALHDLGFFGGTFVERLDVFGASGITLLALTAVYLLGLMYFVGQGGLRRVLGFDEHDTSIELVALRPAGEPLPAPKDVRKPHADEAPAPASPEAAPIDEPSYQDRLSKQIALVQRYYRLSARETEVMELIARGNTVARIAEKCARALCVEAPCAPSELLAYVGPHVGAADYEVSEELAARFAAEFGPSVVPTPRHLDLTAAVVSALASAGVDEKSVAVCDVSTASATNRFFSYRAESGETGRHGAIALMGAGEATL